MFSLISVDWISATIRETDSGNAAIPIMAMLNSEWAFKAFKPMHGYTGAIRWDCGVICMKNPDRPEMGTHFIFSGDALRTLAEAGYDALFLLNRLHAAGASLSIIHLSLDIFDGGLTPALLYADYCSGLYSGRSKTGSMVTERERGTTAYVGSWKSDAFFRYYDKAKEQGAEGDWKRLELVLKGDYAKAFTEQFTDSMTMQGIEKILKGKVRAMADFTHPAWQAFMAGESEKLSLPAKKKNSTREWLLTQVAKAIASYIAETGDEKIIDELGAEITAKYSEMIK